MDLFMAICQGLGLALAVGIGGPLAALFVAMMAALGSGIHPDRTDYDFLGATWFLVTLLAVVVIFMIARGREALRWPTIAVLAGIVVAAFSLFVPPVSLLALAALIVLAAGRRRRAGEKYEGLRILR